MRSAACIVKEFLVLLLIILAISIIYLITNNANASAKPIYGIGDNGPSMFSDPNYQSLNTKISRKIIPWNWHTNPWQVAHLDQWVAAATARGVSPLITFGGYETANPKYAPNKQEYQAMLDAFFNRYPGVVDISPWNEANHSHQPTYKHPEKAAMYYNLTVKQCKKYKRKCNIVAADILGQTNMKPWVKKFLKNAKTKPKIWGFHNYSDVNRNRPYGSSDTKKFLKLVKGQVWFTEVGGFYAFKQNFAPDPNRAATATSNIFKLANKSKRIKRVYFYSWYGTPNNLVKPYLWDSAFTDASGNPRPSFFILKKKLGIK